MKSKSADVVIECLTEKIRHLEDVVDDLKDELKMRKDEHAKELEEYALSWRKSFDEAVKNKKETEEKLKTQEERDKKDWITAFDHENGRRVRAELEASRLQQELTGTVREISSLLVQKDKATAWLSDKDKTIALLKATVDLLEKENKLLKEMQQVGGVIGRPLSSSFVCGGASSGFSGGMTAEQAEELGIVNNFYRPAGASFTPKDENLKVTETVDQPCITAMKEVPPPAMMGVCTGNLAEAVAWYQKGVEEDLGMYRG